MSFDLAARWTLTTVIGAVGAAVFAALLFGFGMGVGPLLGAIPIIALLSLLGALLIGLPIAALTYRYIKDDPEFGYWQLTFVANGVAIVLLVLGSIFLGVMGLILLGIPILVASNSFSIAGWHLLLKPHRVPKDA